MRRFRVLLLLTVLQALVGPTPTKSRLFAAGEEPGFNKPKEPRTDLYGDPLPDGAIARMGTVRLRHEDSISALAFSGDGTVLATASTDKTVRLWRVPVGKELLRLPVPAPDYGYPKALAFSPDGKILAAASGKGHEDVTLHLWDAATGKKRVKVVFPKRVSSPDSIAFSPDGKTLAMAGDDLRLVDVATGREILQYQGASSWARAVAVSADGQTLASSHGDGTIHLWRTATGKRLSNLQVQGCSFAALAFAPDGKGLACGGSDGTIRIWDAVSGKWVGEIAGPREAVASVAFSGDGKLLAVGSWDGTARVLDVRRGQELLQLRGRLGVVLSVVISPDGKTLATRGANSPHAPRLWDVATGKELIPGRGHTSPVRCVAFSPDGRLVVSSAPGGDKVIRLWEAGTGKLVRELHGHRNGVPAVAFSPHGKLLASVSEDRTVRLWDVATGKEVRQLRGHEAAVMCVAFSPDGKMLASGDAYHGRNGRYDGRIRLWETATGKPLGSIRGHAGIVRALTFSADGKLVISASDAIRAWDVGTGKLRRLLRGRQQLLLYCLALSPDGKLLASGGFGDVVSVWEMATGQEVLWLAAQPGVQSLAFSPNGQTLASNVGGSIRLWDVPTGVELRPLRGRGRNDIFCVAYSPSGKLLASGCADSSILIWDMAAARASDGLQPEELGRAELARRWAVLAGPYPARAYQAVWALSEASNSVSFLRERVRPAPAVDDRHLGQLLADLDSVRFAVRDKATADLERMGEIAEPALRRALQNPPSAEVRRRVQQLLEKLDAATPSGQQLRLLRSVQVLEYIGTPEARQVLEVLVKGAPEARLTHEAKASLERLARRIGSH